MSRVPLRADRGRRGLRVARCSVPAHLHDTDDGEDDEAGLQLEGVLPAKQHHRRERERKDGICGPDRAVVPHVAVSPAWKKAIGVLERECGVQVGGRNLLLRGRTSRHDDPLLALCANCGVGLEFNRPGYGRRDHSHDWGKAVSGRLPNDKLTRPRNTADPRGVQANGAAQRGVVVGATESGVGPPNLADRLLVSKRHREHDAVRSQRRSAACKKGPLDSHRALWSSGLRFRQDGRRTGWGQPGKPPTTMTQLSRTSPSSRAQRLLVKAWHSHRPEVHLSFRHDEGGNVASHPDFVLIHEPVHRSHEHA